jgi:hypothetical protein
MKKTFLILIFIKSIFASEAENHMSCYDILEEIKLLEKSYNNSKNLTAVEKVGLKYLVFLASGHYIAGDVSPDTNQEVFKAIKKRIVNLKKSYLIVLLIESYTILIIQEHNIFLYSTVKTSNATLQFTSIKPTTV